MNITIQIKNVYGNQTIYPACEKSRIFAALAGTKTLTIEAIARIRLLGFNIVVAQQTL